MVRTDCNIRYLCYICSIRIDLKAFMFRSIYGFLYCIFLTLHSLSSICLSYALVEYVFVEKGSFDIKKALPLKRWKKEEPPEREYFSDEDSNEDDSNYEEIMIPKKRRAKIKLKASKAASSKHIKSMPKP